MTPLEKALREAVEANDRYASAFTDGATTSEQLERLYDRTLTTARYLVRDHRDELLSLVGERQKLESIAHHAWHLLDDSCDDGNEVTVERDDYDALAVAMDELVGAHGDIHDFLKLPAPPQEDKK